MTTRTCNSGIAIFALFVGAFVTSCGSKTEAPPPPAPEATAPAPAESAPPAPATREAKARNTGLAAETEAPALNSAPTAAAAPSSGPGAAGGQSDNQNANFTVVRVFYATDRNRRTSNTPSRQYGSKRADMSYGTCEVSIPRDHRMGQLEAPSIWRLQFKEDPQKDVVLTAVNILDAPEFFLQLRQRIDASREKNTFVFVHGYNVTFEDAARRTAQMAYDLGFDGAPIFYSWPSRGKTADYPVDETTVDWTRPHLKKFLTDVLQKTSAENVYLIAHSMGNRALTSALVDIDSESQEAKAREKIREIILAAPDIDADIFKRDIMPKLAGAPYTRSHVTLYASARDLALIASKKVHGFARAGDAGASIVLMPGLETIDASAVDTGLVGHSYYGDNRSVLTDIFGLIREHARACDRFGLQPVQSSQGKECVFKP